MINKKYIIKRTSNAIGALKVYLDIFKEWQEKSEITIKDFEQVDDVISKEDLQGAVVTGWITIYDTWRKTTRDFKSVELQQKRFNCHLKFYQLEKLFGLFGFLDVSCLSPKNI